MKLKRIELCNWGRYPNIVLDVDTKDKSNVVLIRAQNDRGKTSLFYAIKYGLYGKKGLENHKNQNLSTDWITHQSAAKGDGEMYVELTIEHEKKEYRIQRKQKFLNIGKQKTFMIFSKENNWSIKGNFFLNLKN